MPLFSVLSIHLFKLLSLFLSLLNSVHVILHVEVLKLAFLFLLNLNLVYYLRHLFFLSGIESSKGAFVFLIEMLFRCLLLLFLHISDVLPHLLLGLSLLFSQLLSLHFNLPLLFSRLPLLLLPVISVDFSLPINFLSNSFHFLFSLPSRLFFLLSFLKSPITYSVANVLIVAFLCLRILEDLISFFDQHELVIKFIFHLHLFKWSLR